MTEWHAMEVGETLEKLGGNPSTGLSEAEARQRREQYGPNVLIERGQKGPLRILLEQLTGIMVIILIISAVISLVMGEVKDAIAVLAIVVLNTILGFTQEYRAEKAMAALRQLSVPVVKARRDGHLREISARDLVPGDIIQLEAGNSVPADARVVESVNMRAQEAILTGESEPVEKEIRSFSGENLPLGDRRNMIYMGTVVSYGRGQAMVVETGMRTQLGRIADLIQGVGQEKTPLQQRLEQLGKGLAVAALFIVGIVFVLGLLRGEPVRLLISTAISMAVAAVPEGLPAVVTIALAVGAQRMLARRALIRKLPAVETLGSVTVICSDKTGTLTQNQMTVTIIDIAGGRVDLKQNLQNFSPSLVRGREVEQALAEPAQPIPLLLVGSALSNDATLEQSEEDPEAFTTVGDPTEGALVIAAARAGLWKSDLEKILPRVAELPFDSDRKRMSTAHRPANGDIPDALRPAWEWAEREGGTPGGLVFAKGAVDGLLEISSRVWGDDGPRPMDDEWRTRVMEANNSLAQNGMRVLGMAFRPLAANEQPVPQELEKDLVFVGMVGMIDPARPEVRDAVETCRNAGIRPIMITGDHPLTAIYIGQELGISQVGKAVTGQELEKLDDEELKRVVREHSVYARVSPEHKLRIVQALQSQNQVVAMTGDGVNDAPALKKADIGVAMGITGTDVSKEASDMVLLDDNFATIVAAVEEGRRIYDNIRKFMRYALASNAGEIWVMLVGPLLGMGFPLEPLQILWVNLVTDGLPGLALTLEPAERNTMRRPPYPPNQNIFARGMGVDILWIGILLGLVSGGVGYWGFRAGLPDPVWRTMIFTTLTLAQMGNVFALRSERESVFKIGIFSNKALVGAVLLTFVLQLAVIYVPFLQDFFHTQALTWQQLLICLAASLSIFVAVELRKVFFKR